MVTTIEVERDIGVRYEPVSAGPVDQSMLKQMDDLLKRMSVDLERPQRPRLVGPDNETIEVPEPVFQLLRQMVPYLLKGLAVSVMPYHTELTTQQAAEILNVSRPFLIGLLERGEIPYVKTGKHRKIRFGDLMTYKQIRDSHRREALARLTQLSQEYGLDANKD